MHELDFKITIYLCSIRSLQKTITKVLIERSCCKVGLSLTSKHWIKMDSIHNQEDSKEKYSSSKDMKNSRNTNISEVDTKSSTGPTVLFFWVWNWFVMLPKTVTNIYAEIRSGELLARFTLLDAMMQFIVAVATSCHPQEEASSVEMEESKSSSDFTQTSKAKSDNLKVFGGQGRTLRSRVVETQS